MNASKRQVSANHHYVPQGILRHFAVEGETVFYFSKRNPERGVVSRNVKSIFRRRHLNSTVNANGSRSDDLEVYFSTEFDDKIVPFIEKYAEDASRKPFVVVSNNDKKFFVQFLYNIMKRTPEFHEFPNFQAKLEEIIPLAVQDYESRFGELPESERTKIADPEVRERIIQNARVDVLARQSHTVLTMMARREVAFAKINKPTKSFIIGSNPVVRMTNDGNMRLDSGNVELWLPVNPKLAVGLLTPLTSSNVLSLDDRLLRNFNSLMLKQSLSVAARSRRLLDSLVQQV